MSQSASTAATPAPSTPKAAPKPLRYEQLDAFRLIVIAVVTFHTFQHSEGGGGIVLPPGSWYGSIVANLDFLLSFYFMMAGFGLAVTLLRPVLQGKELPTTGAFLGKRLARLLPLYIVVFLVVWELRYAGTERQWSDFFWGLTLMQSWSTEHIFATIDPAWYLSVEVGFLLAAAFALLPLLRRISRWERPQARLLGVIGIAASCIGVGLAWKLGNAARGVPYNEWGTWFAPPAWMDLWGIGMLFGLAIMKLDSPTRWAPRGVPLALTAASLSWLWFLVLLSDQGGLPRTMRWLASSAGLLGLMVAAVMARPERLTRRVMASAPIQTFGAVSFGMFLVHAPVLRYLSSQDILPLTSTATWAVSTLALLAMSAVVGWFTLRYIETPAQGLTRLHLPERARRWHEARPIRATLRPGAPCPGLLYEHFDQGPGPLLVVITPSTRFRSPEVSDPALNTMLELVSNRFLIDAVGGQVGIIVGENAAHLPRIERIMESEGVPMKVLGLTGEQLVRGVGIAGHKLRSGDIVPERTAIVVSPEGVVIDLLQHREGSQLARQAIDVARIAAGAPAAAAA